MPASGTCTRPNGKRRLLPIRHGVLAARQRLLDRGRLDHDRIAAAVEYEERGALPAGTRQRLELDDAPRLLLLRHAVIVSDAVIVS